MDVEREIQAAQRRVIKNIERNYIQALARIESTTPEAIAKRLDAERRAAEQERANRAMEQVGANLRRMRDTLVSAANSLARGWEAAGRES